MTGYCNVFGQSEWCDRSVGSSLVEGVDNDDNDDDQ